MEISILLNGYSIKQARGINLPLLYEMPSHEIQRRNQLLPLFHNITLCLDVGIVRHGIELASIPNQPLY
jgi:hypothetical protein